MNLDINKIYVCKNCGIRRSQDCFNCQTCGFYDQESEEYNRLLNIERTEIDKTNRVFLDDYLNSKGFEGIKGYDDFLENEAKKHKLFVIFIRILSVLIGFYYFYNSQIITSLVLSMIGILISSLYRWYKFGKGDKMDDWNLIWNKERCASYHILGRYKENKKLINKDIEHELYF
jgi:hypothetical protein